MRLTLTASNSAAVKDLPLTLTAAAMRWTAVGFLEAEKAFRRLRGHASIPALIRVLRPVTDQLKKAA